MRTRFLITIFGVLAATISAVSFVHFHFFRIERMEQIDRQIEQFAALIYASDFDYAHPKDRDEVNEQLETTFGSGSINLVVLVRDLNGKIVYENDNSLLMETNLSHEQKWQTVELEKHAVRVLTLNLAKRRRILQVGLVLDQNLLQWRSMNLRVLSYMVAILLVLMLVSVFLRFQLLKPLVSLADRLQDMITRIETGGMEIEAVPETLPGEELQASAQPQDEFERLNATVRTLAGTIRRSFRTTRLWSAQMVHELKTPITIVRANLESGLRSMEKARLEDAVQELDGMARMVDVFMEWLAFENEQRGPGDLHVLKLQKTVEARVRTLEQAYPGRLKMSGRGNASLLTDPELFRQFFDNLAQNALKYSDGPVEISTEDSALVIRDQGPGIPQEVLTQLGKPFNRGKAHKKGSGLGLAWAMAICKRYEWQLQVDSRDSGTTIQVLFPSV